MIEDEVVVSHPTLGSWHKSDIFGNLISIVIVTYYIQHRDWVSNNLVGFFVALGV